MSHNRQKKIALFNDITGFGKCSVTVQLPIISAMKLCCCPVPTAILSNHTAYEDYFIEDYTKNMHYYLDNWKKLKLKFDGVITGFLGSEDQIEIVSDFVKHFLKDEALIIVDPIMADDGALYATYTSEMCEGMKKLVSLAHIVTPNLTECCFLTDTPYKKNMSKAEIKTMARKLSLMGPEKIVITGIETDKTLYNYVYVKDKLDTVVRVKKYGASRCGTGDVFSSIVAADAVNGVDFYKSVVKAARFVSDCLKETMSLDMDPRDGVVFENLLYKLGR